MPTINPVRTITAGIAFDDNLEQVVRTASQLALLSKAKLRLLHVCDPWSQSVFASQLGRGAGNMVEALRNDNEAMARARLELVRSSIPKTIDVELSVVPDETIHGICQDCEDSKSDLLVLGAHHNLSRSPTGSSDAISVVIDSQIPVLVVHEDAHPNFINDRIRLGIADDFSEGGDSALNFAANLAASEAACDMVHIHIQTGADLREALKSTPLYGKDHDNIIGFQKKIEEFRRDVAHNLDQRSQSIQSLLKDRQGTLHQDMAFGGIGTEIERSANAFRCDFMVFGKHRMFHKDQLTVGRLPFKSMLAQNRGVIITP